MLRMKKSYVRTFKAFPLSDAFKQETGIVQSAIIYMKHLESVDE